MLGIFWRPPNTDREGFQAIGRAFLGSLFVLHALHQGAQVRGAVRPGVSNPALKANFQLTLQPGGVHGAQPHRYRGATRQFGRNVLVDGRVVEVKPGDRAGCDNRHFELREDFEGPLITTVTGGCRGFTLRGSGQSPLTRCPRESPRPARRGFFQIFGYELIPTHEYAANLAGTAELHLDVARTHFDGRFTPEIRPLDLNTCTKADADSNGAQERFYLHTGGNAGVGVRHEVKRIEIDNGIRTKGNAGPGEAKVGTDLYFNPCHQGFRCEGKVRTTLDHNGVGHPPLQA